MDPESSAEKAETREDVNDTWREFGSERADALRRTTSDLALGGSTQSLASVEARGLLSLFSDPEFPSPWLEQRGP